MRISLHATANIVRFGQRSEAKGMAMIEGIKRRIKGLLKGRGYTLFWSPLSAVNGFDFARDLKILIPKEDPLCLDVGANVGQTIEYLQTIFTSPTIHAFEPASAPFKELQSKAYGERVSLFNFALGNEITSREFINYEQSVLSSFHAFDVNPENRFRQIRVKDKQTVEVKTVDWFLQTKNIEHVDLLKIDAQGSDLQVLKGSTESLRRGLIENVFVEVNFVQLYENQDDAGEIFDLLAGHDMRLVDFYEKARQDHALAWCTSLYTKRRSVHDAPAAQPRRDGDPD